MINIRIQNPNYHFGERLTHLMELAGIDLNSKKPGPDRLLLDMILQNNLITLGTEEWKEEKETIRKYEASKKYDYTKVISNHRKKALATEVSSEWINRYCQLFNCDSDYLFGYIDTPSRVNTDICKATGLSEKSVQLFLDIMEYPERMKVIKSLLPDSPDRYKDEYLSLNKNTHHIPRYLIPCINLLLESCYDDRDSENIIDLIYKYLFMILPEYPEVYSKIKGDKGTRLRPIDAPIRSDCYIAID